MTRPASGYGSPPPTELYVGHATASGSIASGGVELPPPAAAAVVFGAQLPTAIRYAQSLATEGVLRGLIGPREVSRLWDRHLLNSAALAELVPPDARVIDVGSGAGLPGIPLALCRPDVRVDLVEPLLRRATYLDEVVAQLELAAVRVFRGRAPDIAATLEPAECVTARAVAPLDRLVRWCLPLVRPGGLLLAVKGATAGAEVAALSDAVRRMGMEVVNVHELQSLDASPTWVVSLRRSAASIGRGR